MELSSELLYRGERFVDFDRIVKPTKVLQYTVSALTLVPPASSMRSLSIFTLLDQIN